MPENINYAYLSGALEGVMRTLIFNDNIPKNWKDRDVFIENLINKAKNSEREYTSKER